MDNNGDLYIVRAFYGTVDFDPGPGVLNITSNGYEDVFIVKLDSFDDLLWIKTIGGLYDDEAVDVCFDSNSNVIVSGTFEGTVDLDPGLGVYNQTAMGNKDCFISKLTNTGDFIWAKCIQGGASEESRNIKGALHVYIVIAGIFRSVVDFDSGIPVYYDTSASSNYDFFILKLNSSGNFKWVYTNGDIVGDSIDKF